MSDHLECPSDETLALFLRSGHAAEQQAALSRHIDACRQCFRIVSLMLEVEVRESAGLLKPPSAAFARALERFASVAIPRKTRRSNPWESGNPPSGFFSVLPGIGLLGNEVNAHSPVLGSLAAEAPETTQEREKIGILERSDIPDASVEGKGRSEAPPTLKGASEHKDLSGMPNVIHTRAPIHEAPHTIGAHENDVTSDAVRQHYVDTCVLRCQQLVLRQYGVDVSEEQLIAEARSQGWYSQGHGVRGEFVGDLLSAHGVPTVKYTHANIFNLTAELAQGHKVIIGVDSGDLWGKDPIREWLENAFGGRAADHAVIVSGIDTTDPKNVKIVITDPGTGDVAKAYPLEDFLSAWKDSGYFMMATKTPAPVEYNPEMANFDYSHGHLPYLGRLPYDQFERTFGPCTDLQLSGSVLRDQAESFIHSVRCHGPSIEVPHTDLERTSLDRQVVAEADIVQGEDLTGPDDGQNSDAHDPHHTPETDLGAHPPPDEY